jgi:predicted acylesterase/phospholipase RssA
VDARHPLIEVRAGPRALMHLRTDGLAPADIRAIPAAAGGPKGLALIPLDRRLALEWLPRMPRVELAGASIGAWRMAALAQRDPIAALDRLERAYVHDQNYPAKPTPTEVSATIRAVARQVLVRGDLSLRDGVSLDVITARARGPLAARKGRAAFARAAVSNTLGREHLARHLQRVVFHAGAPSTLVEPPDAFGLLRIPLSPANVENALTATGSIPIVCEPVSVIAGAPAGEYWDGGLIDYHLLLPHSRLDGIVLHPHFVPHVTPGWLDKFLPWRKSVRAHPWLANLLLIAPSPAFLARLPNRKLPDRDDFYKYGQDHAARIRDWKRAIAECQRFADAAMEWLDRPNPKLVKPI